jgi:hypothetical protein
MEGLKISIPQRLYYLRALVTLGLIISFLLSLNLWGGERYFPSIPVFEHFFLKPPYDYVLVFMSLIFLLSSLIFHTTRTFIFLALLSNCFLVLFDVNRLQPWFYIYNAILFVFMFYDGRVDNPNKFTAVFIYIQLIVAAVYVYNGVSQLMNPFFVITDFYDAILPLRKIMSERQFLFFLKFGKFVPFLMIFIGAGLLIRPVKYLAISFGIALHLLLFIFLFPSANNHNYALWFMNLVFGTLMIFLYSGKTQQRYFSNSVLLQRPLFYGIVIIFWIMPAFNSNKRWPGALSFNFKSGSTPQENVSISEDDFDHLPYYVRGFCTKTRHGYVLKLGNWCHHELSSEYFDHASLVNVKMEDVLQVAGNNGTETDALSLK